MDLNRKLSNPSEIKLFSTEMAAHIRNREFSRLEDTIRELNSYNQSSFSRHMNIPLDEIRIDGWNDVIADITNIGKKGKICTAVSIDISGYGEGDGAYFENSYYDDGPFPFSTSSQFEISENAKASSTPWQGNFIDGASHLTCPRLDAAFKEVQNYPHRHEEPIRTQGGQWELPPEFGGFTLCVWFLYLRVNQAIQRDLQEIGLPSVMPVIVGQHGFGPGLDAVYTSGKAQNHQDIADKKLNEREEASKKRFLAEIDQKVSEYETSRANCIEFSEHHDNEMAKSHIEFCEAREERELKWLQISLPCPSWKLSQSAFRQFLVDLRRQWVAMTPAGKALFPEGIVDSPYSQKEPPYVSIRQKIFGRKGL